MSNNFNKWNTLAEDSIFEDGIPTQYSLTKYGLLNIIDYHFDGSEKTPYDVNNGNAQAINSFLLDTWDFLKNIDPKLVDSYYNAACDGANYILALSRFNKRKCIINKAYPRQSIKSALNDSISKLYSYYHSRKNFTFYNEIDKKFGFENNYNITIGIVQGQNVVLLENESDKNKITTAAIKEDTYFEYYLDSGFYIDNYGESTDNKFMLFELFNAIVQSLKSYKEGSYINIFEEYLKLYFYKRLTEKYRTKEIEEDTRTLIKKIDFDNSNVIPTLYGRLDGKYGLINTPNVTKTTKKVGFKDELDTINIPFYKSYVKDGELVFYIESGNLPSSFNGIKKYSNIKEYISKDTIFFKRIFNDTKEIIVNNDQDSEFYLQNLIEGDNVYRIARNFVDENIDLLTEFKLRELMCFTKPYFSFDYPNNDEEQTSEFFRTVSKDYEIINDISFGEEKNGKNTRYFAKIVINIDKQEYINLGTGYIKIQQKTALLKDNQINHFVSDEIKEITVYNELNYQPTKYTGEDALNKIRELNGLNHFVVDKHIGTKVKYYEYNREYEIPDGFETALDDREVSIIHIQKDSEVPSYKVSSITTDGSEYYLNVTKFQKYNKIESMRQVHVLDKATNNEYFFNIKGIKETVDFSEEACLVLSNSKPFDSNYVFDNTLYLFLMQGIDSGEIKVAKTSTGNEIVITSDDSGRSTVVGDTLIIGKEYKAGILNDKEQYITIVKDEDGDDEDYCLEISVKDINSDAIIVESYGFVTRKYLILDNTDKVAEYLKTIPITDISNEETNMVYILSFNQYEGGVKTAYLEGYIGNKINVDQNDMAFTWEIANSEVGETFFDDYDYGPVAYPDDEEEEEEKEEEIKYYTLTIDNSIVGHYLGEAVMLRPDYIEGYKFLNWTDNDGNKYNEFDNIIMDKDYTLTSHYREAIYYMLTVTGIDRKEMIEENTTAFLQPNPKKEGFEFVGYFDENGKEIKTSYIVIEKDTTIEARFNKIETKPTDPEPTEPQQPIDPEPTEPEPTYFVLSLNGKETKYLEGSEVTLKSSTKSGYVFIGWVDETGKLYESGEKIIMNNNMYLTPKFREKVYYTVTVTGIKDYTAVEGSKLYISIPKKDGYEFVGFFDKNGNKVTNPITVNSNMVLEARFKKVEDPTETLLTRQINALGQSTFVNEYAYFKSLYSSKELGVILLPSEYNKDDLVNNETFRKWLKFYNDKGVVYLPKFNTGSTYLDIVRTKLPSVKYVFAINKACPPKIVEFNNIFTKYENDGNAKQCATDHWNTFGPDNTLKNGYYFGRAYFKKMSDFLEYLTLDMNQYKTFGSKRIVASTARPFSWSKIFGFWEESASEGICESLFGTCLDIDADQKAVDNYILAPTNNGIFGYTGHASQCVLAMDNAGLEVSEQYVYSSGGITYSDLRNAKSRMILISNGCMVGEHYQSVSGNSDTFSLLGTSKLVAVFGPACYGEVISNNFCYPFEETFLKLIKQGYTLGYASWKARYDGCSTYNDFFQQQMQFFGNPAFKAY